MLWYRGLAARRCVMTLLNKLCDNKGVAMNENEDAGATQAVCEPRPNLASEAVFHAVYIPQDKDSPENERGNQIGEIHKQCVQQLLFSPFEVGVLS